MLLFKKIAVRFRRKVEIKMTAEFLIQRLSRRVACNRKKKCDSLRCQFRHFEYQKSESDLPPFTKFEKKGAKGVTDPQKTLSLPEK